ncbi:hypothetical protein U9M48_009388 [Paspalum notatum var. saurae]|uniref:Uncharacterized protein n=1 Tax=Paspalum notatum var. saurae TaxID=547442 RepID=A0AAQ3WEX9_PASNO
MPPIAGAGASSLGISTMMDSVVVIREETLQKQGNSTEQESTAEITMWAYLSTSKDSKVLLVTTASTAIEIPRLKSIAFIPAATDLQPSKPLLVAQNKSKPAQGHHTISSCVISCISNLLHKACTNILYSILKFNALSDSHTILCDFGTHCHFDRVSQLLNTPQHEGTGFNAKLDVLGSIIPAPGKPTPNLHGITHMSTI